jgi:hypothetical protein
MTSARDILIAAKALIENVGWCQRTYAKKGGKPFYAWTKFSADAYCIVGAIEKSAYQAWLNAPPVSFIEYFNRKAWTATELCKTLLTWDKSLGEWNDLPTTTKENVLAVLDDAIETCVW